MDLDLFESICQRYVSNALALEMDQQNRIFVALLYEVFPGVIKDKNISVVQRLIKLHGVDNISLFSCDLFYDLLRREPVLIHAIIEIQVSKEPHAGACNQEFTLYQYFLCSFMLVRHDSESPGTNFFSPIFIKLGFFKNGYGLAFVNKCHFIEGLKPRLLN